MSELFMFDTICDDIIGEILKYIKWCKALHREKGEKDPYVHVYHRLLCIERPIITYSYDKWIVNNEHAIHFCKGKLLECDLQTYYKYKNGRNRTIKTDKKGLISYTYDQCKFKQIAM